MSSIRALLESHEISVSQRLRQLYAEIAPLERELAEIHRAKAAIGRADPQLSLVMLAGQQDSIGDDGPSPYRDVTIKELIRRALRDQFQNGASATELVELFSTVWGRPDIVRTSLSPQLSRLKADGELNYFSGRWHLKNHSPGQTNSEGTATQDAASQLAAKRLGGLPRPSEPAGKSHPTRVGA